MLDRKRHLKMIGPLTLIVLALWLLSGCVFIPAFSITTRGKNAAAQVGGPHSWAKLKTGRATAMDVERVLGPPPYASADGSQIAYTWQTLNGFWIWPLCFAAQADHGYRTLELTFDQSGILKEFHVRKANDGLQMFDRPRWGAPIPPGMQRTNLAPDVTRPRGLEPD